MKIAIIGPGALGCLFASRLFLAADEQDDILLIDHRPTRADSLNSQGILYESDSTRQTIALPVSSAPEAVGTVDVLFSCVKSYDLKKSLTFAAPLLSPSTLLIFLQNGISHLEYNDKQLHAIPVFGTSSEGATRLAPGHIRHAGSGQTYLGFLSPQQGVAAHKRLQKLADILHNSGISSSISTDIRSRIWAKLFVNVGINALTGIYNCPNGEILTSAALRDTSKRLVKEAEQVAIASGITIKEDPVAATFTVCKRTAHNISSMLQDIRNFRPTEIDAINGAISRLGRQFAIATPLNDKITSQIKTMEKKCNEHTKQ